MKVGSRIRAGHRCALVAALLAAVGAQAGIVINPAGSFLANKVLGPNGSTPPTIVPTIGLNTTDTATGTNGSSSATYDLTESSFAFGFAQTRNGVSGVQAGSTGGINFQPTVDTTYNFADFSTNPLFSYALTGGRSVSMSVYLIDIATNNFLFRSWQQSSFTTNEVFRLGAQEGDTVNLFAGSIAGTLTAGRSYGLINSFFIANQGAADSGASASGGFSLNFAPIPSPDGGLLGTIGCGMLLALRTRGI